MLAVLCSVQVAWVQRRPAAHHDGADRVLLQLLAQVRQPEAARRPLAARARAGWQHDVEAVLLLHVVPLGDREVVAHVEVPVRRVKGVEDVLRHQVRPLRRPAEGVAQVRLRVVGEGVVVLRLVVGALGVGRAQAADQAGPVQEAGHVRVQVVDLQVLAQVRATDHPDAAGPSRVDPRKVRHVVHAALVRYPEARVHGAVRAQLVQRDHLQLLVGRHFRGGLHGRSEGARAEAALLRLLRGTRGQALGMHGSAAQPPLVEQRAARASTRDDRDSP
mmetsp:Transcript_36145/g.114935  ORF Transcript_36145/g.114935 Transcript_36145/m.114935 type:complete len:275 (-) Transcript_36145:77-901(-)